MADPTDPRHGTGTAPRPAIDRRGGGPLVVFVHGLLDRGRSFEAVAARLDDVEVVTYDRRGCGASAPLGVAGSGLPDHVDDLIAILESRGSAAAGGAVVVGHSFGGQVAVVAALRRPDLVRAIGLFETAQAWQDWWPEPHRSLVLASSPPARPVSPDDPEDVRRRRATELATCAADKASIEEAPYELEEVSVPIRLGWGAESLESAVLGYEGLAARHGLASVAIAGAGHMAHRTHPDAFAHFVRETARAGPR